MDSIDLHIHSNHSDGTDSPSALAKLAKDKGLRAIALTDHDTTSGLAEFTKACRQHNIEGICGIELSSLYHELEIHIVGLFIVPDSAPLSHALHRLQKDRTARNVEMAERFAKEGIFIDLEEMKQLYPVSILTRAHFADYLLRKKLVSSRNEAFERYIGDNRPCYIQRKTMSSTEAIDLIHRSGGLAVLAHPLLYRLGHEALAAMVSDLRQHGLDAMEALYSTFSTHDEAAMKLLAKQNHLNISGGSDYHGANKPDIHLGCGRGRLQIPYNILKTLKDSRYR